MRAMRLPLVVRGAWTGLSSEPNRSRGRGVGLRRGLCAIGVPPTAKPRRPRASGRRGFELPTLLRQCGRCALAGREHLVDESVPDRLFGGEDLVAVDVLVDLLDALVRVL